MLLELALKIWIINMDYLQIMKWFRNATFWNTPFINHPILSIEHEL